MADDILFLTELLGLKVFDLKGRSLGVVKDAALVPLIDASRVDRFLVGGGVAWLNVRHDQIRTISLDGISLKDEQLTPYHSDEYMLRLVRDLLDQQIIDGQGRKVVRVTDVTFKIQHEPDGDLLSIIEVDIGLRSIFRRLAQGVIPRRLVRRLQVIIPPHSLRWEHCSILETDPQRRLRLNVSNEILERMHPADLADIVEDLSPEDREAIFESIDSEVAADTLSEVEPDIQASILESLEAEKAADIVEEMAPNEAADVLAELEEQTSEEILQEMEPEPKTEVEELLEYSENSAGGLMNTEFVALPQDVTVAGAMEALKAHEEVLEKVNTLFLVDTDEHLKAAVPLARLFTAPGATPLRDLAAETLLQVDVNEKQDRITEIFDKYNLLALPVVDDAGKLAGAITADEIISLLRAK
ncbi:MAG TPA: CBS domain-containing protein [Bryobacteraceae bacterium]|nr:CBS domain-containing protein [Bryobacteraceae bacterium]